ncbi:hypothetical protein AAG991_16940, partial [Enterobacter kobei]
KIGPDPRNFNQRVSLGRNDLLIRTFPSNILVDGHHYNLVRTSDRVLFTSAETPKEKVFLRNNDGILAYQNGLPVRGKQMSVTIKIIPVINDVQLRGISDNTELESALAWELLTTE